jgi:hypothetical protein
VQLLRARPIALGAIHSHHNAPQKTIHLLALGQPENVVQDGVYPHLSDHGHEDLASGPGATVQRRPYTGSDGGGRAGSGQRP